ncbi:M23 family metallopeptidase [Zobellia galactanivorans]|uniref:Metallopeptidase, family M23 n=1 Tax=Zobellia galactanivorans (strain DSM 12802 / CCUG 47099 / CIP 106680 / NCIMB 13871 / Dsij) TaxID=63186 RepID=G0L7B2_ZOBGA|nr:MULTISPECIES: M23 family metallopeptidase [Zobellia]MBU3025314.1 M23 family metallopeptidase [Zobellia galactanivorans]MDO6810721.1 M23 family metallopeptidase [Zobellia galactanivorans]OWW23586.1 peptidase M23 [Zobellia sp. OII3]CAZ97280.1 Metallopeptidase, family M23 [Zobellia galactanivorans]
MRKLFVGLSFLFSVFGFSQEKYPQDAFRSPIDIPMVLAGTFGELRSNHFHSGIDIKTQQREGLPIYAVADGSVTRIKVSLWGYGKVLYIAHPNGYTSVYGHLQKFAPKIQEFVKKLQYKKQAYEVEDFPDYAEIKVKKGEIIAYGGNTGGSSGPHLHFEIRSSISEKPTNPLLYGFDVRDATNPTLLKLYGFPLSDDAQINQNKNTTAINFTRQQDGTFLADPVSATGTIGLGFVGYDRQDLAANHNGVYSVQQLVNGKVYTDYDFESFSFGETRYINTLIDYYHYGKYRQRIQRLYKAPGNRLSIYNKLENDGKIEVKEGLSYKVELLIKDYAGNETKAIIPIEGKTEPTKIDKDEEKTENYVIAKKPNNYDLGGAKVYFPANTFYDNFYIDLKKGEDTVTIHNNRVPAHRNFTITFDVSKYSEAEKKQMFIARLDSRLRPSHTSTYKRGNTFTTRTRYLGTYTLAKDTVAPKIRPKNFKEKQWLNNYHYLSLRITDDLSGIDTYSATLNGKWILMEYEPKTNTITYNFDDVILNEKECHLEVTVTDNVGNTNTFTSTFYRK